MNNLWMTYVDITWLSVFLYWYFIHSTLLCLFCLWPTNLQNPPLWHCMLPPLNSFLLCGIDPDLLAILCLVRILGLLLIGDTTTTSRQILAPLPGKAIANFWCLCALCVFEFSVWFSCLLVCVDLSYGPHPFCWLSTFRSWSRDWENFLSRTQSKPFVSFLESRFWDGWRSTTYVEAADCA